jgi:hypothetical protein
MADIAPQAPRGPTTADGFLADRRAFWASALKFVTYVMGFLVVLLLFLWWWLV